MVYMSLEKGEFTPEKIKEYNNASISDSGNETGLLLDSNDEVQIDEFKDGVISAHSTSKFGFVSFDIELDDDTVVEIIEYVTKKLNKFKTMIESLK